MNLFDWKKFRNTNIFITPDLPEKATKRYKFSLLRIGGYVFIYTFISWLVLILILGITPLKDVLFVLDQKEYQIQVQKVADLQEQVLFLTTELQKVASTNEKMKYAIKLAQGDSLDSSSAFYDTLKKPIKNKLNIGGNILHAFNLLFEKLFQDSSKSNPILFITPVSGSTTQKFNPDKGHFGIDFGIKTGSPVYAASGGLVVFSDYTVNDGNMIIINHDNNFVSIYKHCSSLLKNVRDVVRPGELIALSGNSGKNTTGPHLHFELWKNGKPVDPEKYLIK